MRDAKNLLSLASLGWDTLVIWECETLNISALCARLLTFLESK